MFVNVAWNLHNLSTGFISYLRVSHLWRQSIVGLLVYGARVWNALNQLSSRLLSPALLIPLPSPPHSLLPKTCRINPIVNRIKESELKAKTRREKKSRSHRQSHEHLEHCIPLAYEHNNSWQNSDRFFGHIRTCLYACIDIGERKNTH